MKITIIETKTISTEIEVDADSVEQAQELYNEGKYAYKFANEFIDEWDASEDQVQFLVNDEIIINWK
jgi:hypothetical protein